MFFTSTRKNCEISASAAIAKGISDEGGLFVPSEFPRFLPGELESLVKLSYKERAARVLHKFLTDYTAEELGVCVEGAYEGNFDNNEPAPVKEISPGENILELWHGPTCAFKDMALQILPYLLSAATRKNCPERTTVILVATSGDTGKAALDGFADVPGTRIIVFFPRDGVSDMQKLQMTTQKGENVAVCAIEGNFDDAQTGVKNIFADKEIVKFLEERNMEFSSANSINFGRLAPQIVYYISSYCDLVKSGKIAMGSAINVAVPTGNFGNILAAYYAKQMGLPIKRFICASNRNNILADFIGTGVYDRNREFFTTESPSMDILISSNLERLLYHLSNGDCAQIAALMGELKSTGRYTVSKEMLAKLQQEFYGGYCDDAAARETIRECFEKQNYLCDTHTAVAVNVYRKYAAETGDTTPVVIASTASPYKFAPAVLNAVGGNGEAKDGFAVMEELSALTGTPVPAPLAGLREAEVLHKSSVAREAMSDFVRSVL
ncbi:MAG: threonine synthase [Lentisphaeria bacterium]|nr:threonine synthase [Lentisphaeria bacterium]